MPCLDDGLVVLLTMLQAHVSLADVSEKMAGVVPGG